MRFTLEKFGARIGRYLLKKAQMYPALPMPPAPLLDADQEAQLLAELQKNELRGGIGIQKKNPTATESVPRVVTLAK